MPRASADSEASRCVFEGFADRLTPAFGVAAVVNLVEHHKGASVLGADPMPGGVLGYLGVGDDDAVVLGRRLRGRIAELRIECEADARGRQRPLRLEMFGGHHDGDLLDGVVG